MKRRALRIPLALSLLISIVSFILLPISYYWTATLSYVGRSSTGFFGFGGGHIILRHQYGPGMLDLFAVNPTLLPSRGFVHFARDRTHYFDFNRYWLRSMRFSIHSFTIPQASGRVVKQRFVGLPIWFLAWAFAMPPAIALQRHRKRQRRIRNGLCLACGYDLRASGERCPECGASRV
jgi:hypothetical protein